MALKKRNKVNAEFNMSSLTDIIFLLLIFFMLTSSLVAPNALNLKLPGDSSARVTVSETPPDVAVTRSGSFRFNGKTISRDNLERAVARLARASTKPTMTISPQRGTPVEHVVYVMDMAMRYHVNAILATKQ
jgi:biopolymer transport protein ExbD